MTKKEFRSVLALASIYAFRMLGLFMILPVFSLYTSTIIGATPLLIGVALGVYGLTQALLQIPFGMASDFIGRKPVIILGLCLFAGGSVIAAESHSILGIIIGRALQGAGAIGSTLTAFVADVTEDEHRLKAMSLIGMTIGVAFVLAMVLGPLFNSIIGLSGIFWLTAFLALMGMGIVLFVLPTPAAHTIHRDSEPVLGQFMRVLQQKALLRLNFGIFSAHAVLTALFIVIPLVLWQDAGIQQADQWWVYLPVLILAFFAMVPFIIIAEAKRKMKPVFVGAVGIFTVVQFGLFVLHMNVWILGFWLFLFFTAFTLLEASLPSLVAKIAPAGNKGTAMGVYSSCQFLGIFFGGVVGGYVYHHYGLDQVFLFCGVLGALWFLVAFSMQRPQHLSSKILHLSAAALQDISGTTAKLRKTPGVYDVMVSKDEQIAYLKVDKQVLPIDAFKSV